MKFIDFILSEVLPHVNNASQRSEHIFRATCSELLVFCKQRNNFFQAPAL